MFKHNQYFDGAVQSLGFERHGRRATVGVMVAGRAFHFATAAPERMTVISGGLRVRPDGGAWQLYPQGSSFEIGADSGFDVEAVEGAAAYLCEFL